MKYQFLKDDITAENLTTNIIEPKDQILLENNKTQISKVLNFLTSDTSILLATGFLGTGKTEIIKHCLNALNEETILLWANCYESTNLDDIFLNFFEEFKHLSSHGTIKVPQAKFENFGQRINAYFYSISKPIVIVLNSFQALMPENAQIIIDFITHLSEFAKIKTIIISRNFKLETLNQSIKTEKINFKALDKELFQKYLLANKIRLHGPAFEEFYKVTKGYYFYTTLALTVLKTKQISPLDLLEKHSKSFLSLREFLFQEFLTMTNTIDGHLLRFLTVIRYPVNTTLLQKLGLFDENKLQTLASHQLIEIDNGNIYLKDYYKEITETEIPPNVLIKLHRACAELYEMQLPRKPEERDLLISRRTIRQELEYHQFFIPKKVELTNNIEVYNAQALMLQPAETQSLKQKQTAKKETETTPQVTNEPQIKENQKPKELKDLLFVFNEEEENSLLSGIAESLNAFMNATKAQEEAENDLPFEKILELINSAEKEFNYPHVITLCQKALAKAPSKEFQAKIHHKTALAYSKLNDTYTALKSFNNAKQLWLECDNTIETANNEFFIAKMNYQMFKHNKAKEMLLALNTHNNKTLEIQRNLLLFDIYLEEGDENNAFETCKVAMKLINKKDNPTTISELLFKCGLILETRNQTRRAIEAYEKALKFSEDPTINKHLQQIYSNLTTLYTETENTHPAIIYCKKSLDLCEKSNNIEGIYNAHLKLAQLNDSNDIKTTSQHFESAIKYATLLQDSFYTISALLAYGDYLYSKTQIIPALEKYLNANQYAQNSFLKENLNQIERRILDVKYRISEEIFKQKAKEFNYEK